MSLAQMMHFLPDVFQMTAIMLVLVIKHNTNGLHLFWDTMYLLIIRKEKICYVIKPYKFMHFEFKEIFVPSRSTEEKNSLF